MEPTVLVVASSPEERARVSAWLEEGDLAVVTCPGPRARVSCVGMLGHCPLAEGADAVVLDPLLHDDPPLGTLPGLQVLDVYLRIGLGVVVMGGPSELRRLRGRPGVVPVPRPADYGTLVGAVHEALAWGRAAGAGRLEGRER